MDEQGSDTGVAALSGPRVSRKKKQARFFLLCFFHCLWLVDKRKKVNDASILFHLLLSSLSIFHGLFFPFLFYLSSALSLSIFAFLFVIIDWPGLIRWRRWKVAHMADWSLHANHDCLLERTQIKDYLHCNQRK